MPLLRRVARPMLAGLFIYGGINSLRNPAAHAEAAKPVLDYAAPAIDKAVEASPLEKRPDNETLVKIDGAVKVAAGTLLALGKFPRLSSGALAASLIPTTLAGHRFWEETDPAAKQAQQIHFLKNTALLGGLMIAAADTHGKPSVAWRSRKAAEAASAAISAQAGALSDSVSHATDSVSGLVSGLGGSSASTGSQLADRASALGDTLAAKAPVVKAKAAELGSVASDRAAELGAAATAFGAVASDKAATWGAAASEQAATVGEDLSKRAAKAAKKAEKRGAALQKEVDKRSAAWQKELDKRGKAWEKLADKKGEEWAEGAARKRAAFEKAADRKRAEWEKSARKAAKKARKRAPGYVDQLSALAAQASEQAAKFGGDVASRASDAETAVEGIVRDARKRAAKVVAP